MPRRVLRIESDQVEVEWDGGPLWVSAAGVTNLEPGEYVLVHAGQVLERVAAEEAEEILALYASMELAAQDIPLEISAVEARP